MKSTKTDVFFNRNLSLDGPLTIDGNLYVNGDCNFVSSDINGDSNITSCENPIEVFGDVIIDGNLTAGNLIVHGDLVCKTLNCDSVEADENISVSCITEADLVKSIYGSITINDTACAGTIVALEGSITINNLFHDVSSISSIKAFDDIHINGDIVDVTNMVAGSGIRVRGVIAFEAADYFVEEKIYLSTYSEGIRSENINVNN